MSFLRSRGLTIALAVLGFLGLGALTGAVAFHLAFLRDLPDIESLDDYRPRLATRVLDRHGVQIGEFYNERRQLVAYEDVPPHVVDAFVAGEDSTFFEHAGIDYQSILRAAWVNLRAGGVEQGASTITQQTVKTLLLTPERQLRRKVREMILARSLEQHLSKQEILYLYLNQIYFGSGAYGIGEAARTYFGKPVTELSVSEAALLAGLPKAPSRYSPFASPERAEGRRRYVLRRMREDDLIDEETYGEALAKPPLLAERRHPEQERAAAYFTEEVRRYLFEELGGDAVLNGGLVVETTLDAELQGAALAAVQRGLEDLDERQGYRGPLRHVARADFETELQRLAERNRLLPEEAASAPEAGAAAAPAGSQPGDPEADPAPVVPLPADRLLAGLVLSVDAKAQSARIGFGAGHEGRVELESVDWARPPEPSSPPRKVTSIDAVFREGDVALFAALPDEPLEDGEEPSLPAVTLRQAPIVQGALLSLEVESGDVLAMVGGYDFEESQFNRATQARRQPGSAFKPVIYAAALATGRYTPASVLFDRPVVYRDPLSGFVWRPQNYGRSFYGPITMRQALVRSVNNATVHLFRDVGVDFVIDFARRLGVESPLSRDLSLALGSSALSLLELTRAYAIFPAQGRRVMPVFVRRVLDGDGEVLLENVPLGGIPLAAEPVVPSELLDVAEAPLEESSLADELVIPAGQAYLATDLLRAVVSDPKGTGWRLRALRRPVAGKTGTTNDQGDAWFMGFSPNVVTGVWVGHDESQFLGWGETGSRAAAPIWVDFMAAALERRPMRDFSVPESIVFARIDRKTGLLADGSTQESVFQPFLAGTVPVETARTARTESEARDRLRMEAF